VFYKKFRPTWPSSGDTHYLRDAWQEISYIKYVSFYKTVKFAYPPPKYFMHSVYYLKMAKLAGTCCKTH